MIKSRDKVRVQATFMRVIFPVNATAWFSVYTRFNTMT